MKVLISGFEPFLEIKVNPTELLVKELQSLAPNHFGFEHLAVILPVEFNRAFEVLKSYIDTFSPDVVIATGVAARRGKITPEKIAINLRDARGADNAGYTPKATPIDANGPDGLFSTLNIEAICKSVHSVGVEAETSLSAGSYVCNSVMYELMRYSKDAKFRGGFIHVPPIEVLPFRELKKSFWKILEDRSF